MNQFNFKASPLLTLCSTVAFFVIGTTAPAQTIVGKGSPASVVLDSKTISSKKDLFQTNNLPKSLQNAKGIAQGPGKTGGGNGVQDANGKITPLDVLFTDANSAVDPIKKYPVAANYFKAQLKKIALAIPSLAKNIEADFASLRWYVTSLDLDTAACTNSMGIFKVRSGQKQVVIACQNAEGEVYVSKNALNNLQKPEHLGVVFLHEALVKEMLVRHQGSTEAYAEAEVKLITKTIPYIISNPQLEGRKLYDLIQNISRVTEGTDNEYLLEADPEKKASYEAKKAEKENNQRISADISKEVENYDVMVKASCRDPKNEVPDLDKMQVLLRQIVGLSQHYSYIANSPHTSTQRMLDAMFYYNVHNELYYKLSGLMYDLNYCVLTR